MVAVVLRQYIGDSKTLARQLSAGVLRDKTAGGIRRTVGAIGTHRENRGILAAGQMLRCGQGQFLIPSAEAGAGEFDYGLAAGDECQRNGGVLMGAGESG